MRATCGISSGREQARVRVHVVDGAAVDAERREHAAVVAHAREIRAGATVLPEDRRPAVSALDRSVEVVPLVDPADRRRRRLLLVQVRDRFAARDLSQQAQTCRRARRDRWRPRSPDVARAVDANGLQPIAVGCQARRPARMRSGPPQIGEVPSTIAHRRAHANRREGCGRACRECRGSTPACAVLDLVSPNTTTDRGNRRPSRAGRRHRRARRIGARCRSRSPRGDGPASPTPATPCPPPTG